MPIIDSQVHVYEANTPKRPWHSVPNWPDHGTGVYRDEPEGLSGGKTVILQPPRSTPGSVERPRV
ncbi:MAG TPA: hypothetical protein VEK82_01230 [Stellaceae bacterium]|nr:hypothetical protein [Stellaceae bacterium]